MNLRAFGDRFRSPDGLAILFLAALPLLYFFPATLGQIVLSPNDGLILNLPLRVGAAEMVRDGQLPLWNPYIFGGMPLFACAQAGVLFPLNWPFLVLSPAAAMNFTVLGAYSSAGVGAFLYARRIGANVAGGLVTALVWQASGFLVAHLGHTNIVHVGSLLPWLLWSIDGYGMTRRRGRGAVVALIVALLVFAGHPNMLAYALLLAGSYALLLALGQQGRDTRRGYLESFGFIVCGVALGAVQIIPTLELLRHSLRSDTYYEFFASFSLPPSFLLTSVAPYVFGGGDGRFFRAYYVGEPHYAEYIGYVGLLPLMLALVAPFVARDRRTAFWVGAALVCCALSLGRFLPFDLYRLVYQIPVLNLFRVPARHLMEVDFALAVLAGRAVTFLPTMQPVARRRLRAATAGGLVLASTVAAVTIWRPDRFVLPEGAPSSVVSAPELFVPLIFGALSVCALLAFAHGWRHSVGFIVLVAAVDLYAWGQFSGWRTESPRSDNPAFHSSPVVKFLRDREGQRLGEYRILSCEERLPAISSTASADSAFPVDLAWFASQHDIYMIYRVENAAGLDAFGLARHSVLAGDMKVWGGFPDLAQALHVGRALDLLNVRYFISPAQSAAAPEPAIGRWQPMGTVENVAVHQNAEALPRTWVVAEARPMNDAQKLAIIRSGKLQDGSDWDPRRIALVDDAVAELTAPSTEIGQSRILKYEPATIEIAATSPAPALLVLSENFYPGWSATVDGAPAPIVRVNYNQRGVVLDSGEHLVRFVFRPRSHSVGLLVSVLAAIALVGWMFLPSRRLSRIS